MEAVQKADVGTAEAEEATRKAEENMMKAEDLYDEVAEDHT